MNPIFLRTGTSVGVTGMRRMNVSSANMRAQTPARSFHSGRAYHAEKKQSEISKLTGLMQAQNAKLDSINSRVKALEDCFNERTDTTTKSVDNLDLEKGSIRKGNGVSSIVPKRIRICGKSFSASKIASVNYRHSIMWLTFPYVVELDYQKRTTEFLFGGETFKVPITSDNEQHKFKCKDKTSAINLVADIIRECPHLKNE